MKRITKFEVKDEDEGQGKGLRKFGAIMRKSISNFMVKNLNTIDEMRPADKIYLKKGDEYKRFINN